MAIKLQVGKKPSVIQVYRFGPETDGDASMKNVLGGKGANLAEMAKLGVPVPPGFTIPCSASVQFRKESGADLISFTKALWVGVRQGLDSIGYIEGDIRPLMSVRSGARVSMPGMMDTILNVGLTNSTLGYWSSVIGERAALDSYRRLIQMYSTVVLGMPDHVFESILSGIRTSKDVQADSELDVGALAVIVAQFLKVVADAGLKFPQTFSDQMKGAILAVFRSWDSPRAKEYRSIHGYPDTWGTAVNVQQMVFGNLNDKSATGVLFSRNPSTGEKVITGEWLVNAQGEDVVAGIRTPEPLSTFWEWNPKVGSKLVDIVDKLEAHYRDMQDIEFTVSDGNLYILQTRSGKRAAAASFQIAWDMYSEKLISPKEALARVNSKMLYSATVPAIDPTFDVPPTFEGIAAGGGVVTGVAALTSEFAVNCNEPCVLVRPETSPDDIAGINAAVGVLTFTGGLTSHAAVVARGMHKSCVVGAMDGASCSGIVSGTRITLDGATGRVWVGMDVKVIGGSIPDTALSLVDLAMAENPTIPERVALTRSGGVEGMASALASTKSKVLALDISDIRSVSEQMKALGVMLTKVHANLSRVYLLLDPSSTGDSLVRDIQSLWEAGLALGTVGGNDKAAVFEMMGWPKVVRDLCLAVTLDSALQEELWGSGYGFRVMRTVETVAEVLFANGPIVYAEDGPFIKALGGEHVLDWIIEKLPDEQRAQVTEDVPDAKLWFEFLDLEV